jgi:hypothetical protein
MDHNLILYAKNLLEQYFKIGFYGDHVDVSNDPITNDWFQHRGEIKLSSLEVQRLFDTQASPYNMDSETVIQDQQFWVEIFNVFNPNVRIKIEFLSSFSTLDDHVVFQYAIFRSPSERRDDLVFANQQVVNDLFDMARPEPTPDKSNWTKMYFMTQEVKTYFICILDEGMRRIYGYTNLPCVAISEPDWIEVHGELDLSEVDFQILYDNKLDLLYEFSSLLSNGISELSGYLRQFDIMPKFRMEVIDLILTRSSNPLLVYRIFREPFQLPE